MTDPIQLESPQANINRARFAGKDFFTFVDDIIARIQALFVTEFNDFVVSGTGQMLIDIVSWAAETLSFYIDRQATESYLATARTRKAISRLARQLGYKMSSAVSAVVDLSVNLAEVQAFAVTIPVGFKFQGPNNLVFESVEEVTFPTGEGPTSTPRTVGVREGETRVEVFTSDASKNQIFRLNPQQNRTVAEAEFICRVDGILWDEEEIILFDATDQYEVWYNDVPASLRFGDGIAGNIPVSGAEIRTQYVASSGKAGQVQGGTITDVVDPLVIAATIIPLTITNPLPSTAGSDQEDLERARINASRFYKARDVAVTREDYEGLSMSYVDAIAGAVAVAQAFVAHSAEDDIQLQIYLDNIRNIVDPLAAGVTGATQQIESDRLDIYALRDTADDSTAVIATKATSVDSAADDASAAAQSIKNLAAQIGVDANDIQGHANDGEAQVLAYGPSGTADLDAGQVAILNGFFDLIYSEAGDIITNSGTIKNADAVTVIDKQAAIKTLVDDIETENTTIQTSLDDMEPLLDSIGDQVIIINGLMTTSFDTAIETQLDNIFSHVDSFLSDDCKANLIQVPILTRDVNGFLQGPPIALMKSLENYLNARKEVTQVPEVVSGLDYLVAAVITGTIGILEGFVHETVMSNVNKAIDDLLRVRIFGASLHVSDLDGVTSPNPQTGIGEIAGVKYSSFKILGHLTDPNDTESVVLQDFLDPPDCGDLVIPQKYVITKGLVTLTPVEAVP
jgi:hypothetical protein